MEGCHDDGRASTGVDTALVTITVGLGVSGESVAINFQHSGCCQVLSFSVELLYVLCCYPQVQLHRVFLDFVPPTDLHPRPVLSTIHCCHQAQTGRLCQMYSCEEEVGT